MHSARDCTRGCADTVRESALKVDLAEKSLAAPGNRTCVGNVPVLCSNQLSYIPTTSTASFVVCPYSPVVSSVRELCTHTRHSFHQLYTPTFRKLHQSAHNYVRQSLQSMLRDSTFRGQESSPDEELLEGEVKLRSLVPVIVTTIRRGRANGPNDKLLEEKGKTVVTSKFARRSSRHLHLQRWGRRPEKTVSMFRDNPRRRGPLTLPVGCGTEVVT